MLKHNVKSGLLKKIIFYIVIGEILFTSTTLIVTIIPLNNSLRDDERGRWNTIVTAIKNFTVQQLNEKTGQREKLTSFLNGIKSDEIIFIGVYDKKGSLLGKKTTSSNISLKDIPFYKRQGALIISKAIRVNGKYYGKVISVSNQSGINRAIQRTKATLIFMYSFFILTSAALFWIVYFYWLGRPFEVLRNGAINISKGNLKSKIQISTDDELGDLARSFNTMAESLEARENEIKQTIKKLNKSYNETKQAYNKLKIIGNNQSNFLAAGSHELISPIHQAQSWIETLLSGKLGDLEPGQVRACQVTQNSLFHLQKMCQDIFDDVKADLGKLILKKEKVEITHLLSEAEEAFSNIISTNELKFILNISNQLPIVLGDEQRIKQVFINLIDNAIKFTPKGGTIMVNAESNNKNKLIVSVSDSGPGISQNKLNSIFLPYYRIDSSYTQSTSGLGLGLAIAKQIMSIHGGTINVKSLKNKGSTFTCIFPVKNLKKANKNELTKNTCR